MTPHNQQKLPIRVSSNRRSKLPVPSFFPFFRFDQFHDTQPENSRRTWVVVHCAIFSQRENHVFCIRHTTTSPLLLLLLLLICKLGFSYSSIICKIHCYDSIAIFWMKKVFSGAFYGATLSPNCQWDPKLRRLSYLNCALASSNRAKHS